MDLDQRKWSRENSSKPRQGTVFSGRRCLPGSDLSLTLTSESRTTTTTTSAWVWFWNSFHASSVCLHPPEFRTLFLNETKSPISCTCVEFWSSVSNNYLVCFIQASKSPKFLASPLLPLLRHFQAVQIFRCILGRSSHSMVRFLLLFLQQAFGVIWTYRSKAHLLRSHWKAQVSKPLPDITPSCALSHMWDSSAYHR